MLERVKLQPYVTFVGVSGSGKTATVHHIALKLQQKGYEILPIIDINKIEDYCDPHKPQVFVIDDVLGVYGFDMSAFNVLSKYEERITNPTMPKTKFLMTCREVVYRNEALANTFFSKKNNVVLLNSDDNALTNSDIQILFTCKVQFKHKIAIFNRCITNIKDVSVPMQNIFKTEKL